MVDGFLTKNKVTTLFGLARAQVITTKVDIVDVCSLILSEDISKAIFWPLEDLQTVP